MNLSVLGAAIKIAAKELLESFRDRQTLLYTFVLPVCMYPALFWVMVQGVLVVQGQKNARDVTVGIVASAEAYDAASAALGTGLETDVELTPTGDAAQDPASPEPNSGGDVDIVPVDAELASDEAALKAIVDGDGDDAPDAIVVLPSQFDGDDHARVYYDSTNSRSEIARERSVGALRRWANDLRNGAAEARGIHPDALDPIFVTSNSVAEKKDEGALMLSLMLPMLLVIMSVLGAFFPAVDLTAGEKERGTAETTMLLPVPRTATHLGKILAVSAAAMIATALNLLALGLSAGHLLAQLSGATDGSVVVQLPVGALMSVLPLAVLFAFFVSAMLTGIASLAASFKEGQALLGPVQMLFILPAMAATLPGLTLNMTTAWIPVVNVALAFRAMLVGDVEALPLAICVVALFAAALFAIWFSIRLRSNEQVALAGETLSLGKIFSLLAPTKS